ncbi:myb/SANT-like DNA-binding domain-containing protein 4 [Centruroides vittatus]|uniref:myb/SANT-like DNA-binding domain-containing protein 4 n=1 Tax=Centruroides vittatus TaxID=120091 RepID=UPI00350F2F4F
MFQMANVISGDKMEDRKRRRNFSSFEIQALVDGVEKRKKIIEGRIDQTITSRAKYNCWRLICQEVNSVSDVRRNVEEIRRKWRDYKSISKKKGCWKRMKLEAKKNLINNHQISKLADDSASSELSNEPSKRIIEIVEGNIQSVQNQPKVSIPDFEFQYKEAYENCQPIDTPVSLKSYEEPCKKLFSQINVESQSLCKNCSGRQTTERNINKQERTVNIKRKMRKAILEELLTTEKLKRENERLRKWILTKECEEKGYGLPPPDFN